jgi:hypothetical protein
MVSACRFRMTLDRWRKITAIFHAALAFNSWSSVELVGEGV